MAQNKSLHTFVSVLYCLFAVCLYKLLFIFPSYLSAYFISIRSGRIWKVFLTGLTKEPLGCWVTVSVLCDFSYLSLLFSVLGMDVFWFYNQRKKIIVDFIFEAEFLTYLVTGQRWPGHSDRAISLEMTQLHLALAGTLGSSVDGLVWLGLAHLVTYSHAYLL